MDLQKVKAIIKQDILIERLELEDITPEEIVNTEPLFGEGLGLDSVEALDMISGIEESFGVKMPALPPKEMKTNFYSVDTLANFVITLINN